jgi:imidazolonepropionase-like amidohydrolase
VSARGRTRPGRSPRLARAGLPALLALLAPGTVAAQETIAFRDVSILDVEAGVVVPDRTVIVEGGTIARVGPAAEVEIPADATVIDGTGRFLVPGLADMHVHMERADARLFLANGVTTVREMNGSPAHLALRDSIARGDVLGPRMLVASPLLAGVEQRYRHELVPDSAAAARVAREAAERGYDFLKAYDGLSAPAYEALAEASSATGIPLVGHVPEAVGLDGVLAVGQRSLEHVEQIAYATVGHAPDPARIRGIAERIAGSEAWVVPTLAAQRILTRSRTSYYDALLAAPETAFVDPGILEWWRSLAAPAGAPDPPADDPRRRRSEAFYDFQRELVGALHAAGVPLLVGTDTPNPLLVPGFSIHLELAALVDAGISPIDAIRMATRDAARFAGEEGRWGVVAPGAAANLVLVDANPLDSLAALRAPAGVMVRGTWLDREALDRLLE